MLDSYKFKTPPFPHQHELLGISCDREYYALLMEQGTGKSKPTVDQVCMSYMAGRIDCAIIVAPNGVHRKWVRDDFPLSAPDDLKWKYAIWQASSAPALRAVDALFEPGKYLRVIAINVEAFSGDASKKSKRIPKGVEIVRRLMKVFRCAFIVDESSYIKGHDSSRTNNIIDLGGDAVYRRILSGTASPESPIDLFSQFKFLHPSILKTSSFFAFKSEYAVVLPANDPLVVGIMRKNPNIRFAPQIIATDPTTGNPRYRNLDKLKALIAPHSYRKLKSEVFDLPPKLYKKRYFEMTPQQARLYNDMKKRQKAEFLGGVSTVVQKVTLLMRLSQIVRGYMIDENDVVRPIFDDPRDNPAIKELLAMLEERVGQTIIWCRFKHEIRDVLEVLGDKAVAYYGDTSDDDRECNMYAFKAGAARYFVGTTDAGGIGLDLSCAGSTIFYSNNFSGGKRSQAEDRNHRWGSQGEIVDGSNCVLYEDLVCPDTIDEKVLQTIAAKKNVAEYLMDFEVVYA